MNEDPLYREELRAVKSFRFQFCEEGSNANGEADEKPMLLICTGTREEEKGGEGQGRWGGEGKGRGGACFRRVIGPAQPP